MTARIDRGVGRAIGAAAVSGVLGFAADYPHPIPALLLIAPLPVLVATLRSSAAWAALLGLVWGLVQRADMWRVMSGLGVPLPIVAGMVLGMAGVHAALLAATSALGRRVSPALAALAFPALAVLVEYAAAHGSGLWFVPSATMAAAPWILPVAAWGGPYAIAFVVALVPSTLAVALVVRRTPAAAAPLLLAVGLVVAAVATAPKTPAKAVRVAAVSLRLPAEIDARWGRREVRSEDTWAVLAGLEGLARRAAADGARVVVWPEYGLFVGAADRDRMRARVAALSRETGAVVVGGWIDVAAGQNRAILAAPDGQVADHVKQCLVPVTESSWLAPGPQPFAAVEANELRVAANVCCDIDFPDGPRAAARSAVEILAVPAKDNPGSEERHARQSVLRAAENRMAMVRATREGWSLLVDPSGRLVASASDLATPEVVLVGDLPVQTAGAPFTRMGEVPVAACALLLTAMGLLGRRAAPATTTGTKPLPGETPARTLVNSATPPTEQRG